MFSYLELPFTASSSFFIIHLDLPLTASLVVLWFYHTCLFDWTYNSDAKRKASNPTQLGFLKTPLLFEYYLLSPRKSFWSFYRVYEPRHSASLFQTRKYISDAMFYAMMIMNDMSEHLNLFFSFESVLFLCFRIFCFSLPMCPLWACSSSLSCFYSFFGKRLLPWRFLVTS